MTHPGEPAPDPETVKPGRAPLASGARPAGVGEGAPVLEVSGLTKSFGGMLALDDVSLTIMPGEVHALVGENGSGKSTLIKCLAGFHAPEPGAELKVGGVPVPLPFGPGEFRQFGLSFVHQDLGLIPELTVLENFVVGDLVRGRPLRPIRWASKRRGVAGIFARFGLEVDPSARVLELSQTDRARLAIVRAVEEMRLVLDRDSGRRGLLVLDEATVFLPREGVDQLFELMREIAAQHASVLFVTHDLDEVTAVADRVTVLRDGRLQATVEPAAADSTRIVELIIGRRLAAFAAHPHDLRDAPAGISVHGLSAGVAEDLSFEAFRGEILGLTGLVGSGFDDVPYALFGAMPIRGGEIGSNGQRRELSSRSPQQALAEGVVLVPGDRQRLGSVGSLSVAENITLPVLDRFSRLGVLSKRALARESARLLSEYDVRPPNSRLPFEALSGGNQQKAMMAKWLQAEPQLLLVHEPTQGVDVGARQQIFELLRTAAAAGMTVICASSDAEQLASICDRVLIFAGGRIAREIVGADISKDRISEQILNSGAPLTKGVMQR